MSNLIIFYSLQYYLIIVFNRFGYINTLRPRRNRRHFADEIFKCILLNENILISIKISLKFIPKGPINNIPALVQIMAWRRPGDKPLSEPMMIISLTHICVTRPQWVNSNFSKDRCTIPMDMTVVFGLHKFRLQGTIDHHGPSMYSSHYTASINYCKNILLQRHKNYRVWNYWYKNLSTAYLVMFKLIT